MFRSSFRLIQVPPMALRHKAFLLPCPGLVSVSRGPPTYIILAIIILGTTLVELTVQPQGESKIAASHLPTLGAAEVSAYCGASS